MPQQTADLIALILTGVVAIVVVVTTLAVLYVKVTRPAQDTMPAIDAVSGFVSVIVAALVGYLAGRRVNGVH